MAIISIFARIVHTFSDFLNILFCMMLFVKIYSRGYCIWCHVHFVGNVLIPPAGFFQRHDLPGVNSLLRFTFFLVLYGFRLFYTAFSRTGALSSTVPQSFARLMASRRDLFSTSVLMSP